MIVRNNITEVAYNAQTTVAANWPNKAYNVENFKYSEELDYYICPERQRLTTNGRLHQAKTYLFKRYTTKACKTCPVKLECSKAICGKAIQRSQYQTLVDKNKERLERNENYYKRRQAIAEHPYGTIKRQWGFSYVTTKRTIQRASADIGFMMTAYNLRRIINIIGLKALTNWLQINVFSMINKNKHWKLKLSLLSILISTNINPRNTFSYLLNQLYLTKNKHVRWFLDRLPLPTGRGAIVQP